MNDRQKEKLLSHYEKYLGTSHVGIMHNSFPQANIDAVLYPPTLEYPFWTLATIGASDHVNEKGERHEYVLFIPATVQLLRTIGELNQAEFNWYYNVLMNAAMLPILTGANVQYGSIVRNEQMQGDMKGFMYLLPVALHDTNVLYCDLNENKKVMLLSVVTITQEEIDFAKENGTQALERKLIPLEGEIHPFPEKTRSF